MKVYEVPQGGRTSRGKPIVNLLPLAEGEKINAILPIKEFADDHYVFFCTSLGTVKKNPLSVFAADEARHHRRRSGRRGLPDWCGDYRWPEPDHAVLRMKARRYVLTKTKSAPWAVVLAVRGMRLVRAQVISLMVVASDELFVLTATENGLRQTHPGLGIPPFRSWYAVGVIAIDTLGT